MRRNKQRELMSSDLRRLLLVDVDRPLASSAPNNYVGIGGDLAPSLGGRKKSRRPKFLNDLS